MAGRGEAGAESARGPAGGRRRLVSRLPPPVSRAGFRYSHIPSLPPSRPNPDSRYPPNPAAASKRFVELIQTTPALILGAMSSARLMRSEEHTSELQSHVNLVCRLLLEKKKFNHTI